MKIRSKLALQLSIGVITGLLGVCGNAQPVSAPALSEPVIAEKGPHHRVWQRARQELAPDGSTVFKTNSYVELATGLHYRDDATGEWLNSEELVELAPGGAIAHKLPHKSAFAANINTPGALHVLTPDAKRLRSRILGLVYSDAVSGQSILFAPLKDCIGEVAPPNQVLYKDAFENTLAMVRYTVTKAGIEQDIVFLADPPSPADFGLDPSTTRLEVWTEFFNPPAPHQTAKVLRGEKDAVKRQGMAEPDFTDTRLDFGAMSMNKGRAFSIDGEAQGKPEKQVPVGKTWGETQGRHFLIEKVEYPRVKAALNVLPQTSALSKEKKDALMSFKQEKGEITGFAYKAFPEPSDVFPSDKTMLVAKNATQKGFVLDYSLLSSTNNFTFQGDTTYYVTAPVYISGPAIIEGGAVVKFTNNPYLGIELWQDINCLTDPYRPAIFTSKDDNSVGEQISGSTGNPYSESYDSAIIVTADNQKLSNLRVSYAIYGVSYYGLSSIYLNNMQVMKNKYGVYLDDWCTVFADNCLFYTNSYSHFYGPFHRLFVQNITARDGRYFSIGGGGAIMNATNCLIMGVTNWGLPPTTSICTVFTGNPDSVFQTAGAGRFYLAANSPYRNAGTTNISPGLLAELRKGTTYPPVVYENITITTNLNLGPQAQRDTDQPDLGYHYAPLDYIFGGVHLNANLNVSAGTALGWYRTSSSWYHGGHGIHLADNSQATFNGKVDAPAYWVRRNVAQESETGGFSYGPGGISGWALSLAQSPTITAKFTRFSMLAGDCGNHFRDDNGYLILRSTHCEYWGGGVGGYWRSSYYTNCLFERCGPGLDIGSPGVELVLQNCTIQGASLWVNRYSGNAGLVKVRDTIFNGTTVSPQTDAYSYNATYTDYAYNAFSTNANRLTPTNANDKVLKNFNFQTGPLGRFYLPSDSAVIDAGSCYATNVGLYHFTTTTNQVKEAGSLVDRGYHYVGCNAIGAPLDYDGDGYPDYLEDANGNGAVDNGESSWLVALDTDGDGVPDHIEVLQGRNPFVSGSVGDANGAVKLNVYTPLK